MFRSERLTIQERICIFKSPFQPKPRMLGNIMNRLSDEGIGYRAFSEDDAFSEYRLQTSRVRLDNGIRRHILQKAAQCTKIFHYGKHRCWNSFYLYQSDAKTIGT